MKKKTSRSKNPYPGLSKNHNLKIRQGFIDQDYLHKLSHEEKLMA